MYELARVLVGIVGAALCSGPYRRGDGYFQLDDGNAWHFRVVDAARSRGELTHRDSVSADVVHALVTLMHQFAGLQRVFGQGDASCARTTCPWPASRWEGGVLLDYPGCSADARGEAGRYDPLGGALAVLEGVVGPDAYPALLRCFRGVDSPCGVTIRCKHNPLDAEEAAVIARTDGIVAWPFIVGFAALALGRMAKYSPEAGEMAREQLGKLLGLAGFREWYDPATGKGHGAREQLWSAALLLRALAAN